MMPSPSNKVARKKDTNRVQEGFTPEGNPNVDKSPQHPMTSPGNKDAKKKDTNGVQEGLTQTGNSKADKSPHHSNRVVKQTTVRISRAEQEPAIKSQMRQNFESSWLKYEEQSKEDYEALSGKDLYGLSLLGYADSLADQFITTEIVSETSFLFAGGKRNWNASESQKKGTDRIIESAKAASNWMKFAGLTVSSIQSDLGSAEYLLQFPEAARAAIEELIEEGILTSSLDSFFKGSGWTNTLLQQHFSSLREPIKRKLVETIYKVCNLSCSKLNEANSAPTMEQLAHRLHTLETRMEATECKTSAFKENFKDIIEYIAETQLSKYKADFMKEDLKLSLSHQDKSWNTLDKAERLKQVSSILEKIIPDTWQNCEVWISPNTPKQKHAFAKITFTSRKEKFLFEKLLKEHRVRENENGSKSFISRRMTPISFSLTKKRLLEEAIGKLAYEWCTMVKDLGKESEWISNEHQAGKCIKTRIQFITDPELKVWVEALDPIHQHVWREVIFAGDNNFFLNYNLDEEIPCPHTRKLAETNLGMKKRSVDKYKGDIKITALGGGGRTAKGSSDRRGKEPSPSTSSQPSPPMSPPPEPAITNPTQGEEENEVTSS